MTKEQQLEKIAKEIATCPICQKDTSGLPVPGEGNPHAKIVFLGEAPGKTEAATGRPFIGRSGQLLRKLITQIGLKEQNVYITSPVKYLPDRGTPSAAQIAHGKVHLDQQLSVIQPLLIVLLGATAAKAILPEKISVQKMHGQEIKREGKMYFLTFHPAAALRFPPMRKELEKDFEKLKKLISSLPE